MYTKFNNTYVNMELITIQNFWKYLALDINVQSHKYESFKTQMFKNLKDLESLET